MDRIPEHLDIVFRRIQPESLIRSINRMSGESGRCAYTVSSAEISPKCYLHYAYSNFPHYSIDEIENFHQDMLRCIAAVPAPQSVFNLLLYFSRSVLRQCGGYVVCCAEKTLSWRDVSFLLGQDLFTTSFLAFLDAQTGRETTVFDWPSVIGTDDNRLNAILQKGISENHFHLHGSTQVFALSWMCLMNHPERIESFLKDQAISRRMAENLQETVNLGEQDAMMSWQERLRRAAALRQSLFQLVFLREQEVPISGLGPVFSRKDFSEARSKIELLRFLYGAKYRQRTGREVCLDYAICADAEHAGAFRALSGERRLLYHSFLRVFRGDASGQERNALYLYLLLKAQFRNELIQVNGRVGFRNFVAYQDRKGDFWDCLQEYEAEALRLSVMGSMQSGAVQSLEMRVAPKMTAAANMQSIKLLDELIHMAEREHPEKRILQPQGKESAFYVLHFIKKRDDFRQPERFGVFTPRNADVRRAVRRQAKAIASALARSSYFCSRIRGIDAANVEIGCRPETFATEFRFLRQFIPAQPYRGGWRAKTWFPDIHVTYHAGEDFLDLVDGMRAIDEAVRFLAFQRGDRIGHALALGVEPAIHYGFKGRNIVLPKQVRLDDLVWVLYRGGELGLELDSSSRWKLQNEAEHLLMDIYGAWMEQVRYRYTLGEYYQMWQLRGDAPDLYSYTGFRTPGRVYANPCERFYLQEQKGLSAYRSQRPIARLYYGYHFDNAIKKKGTQVVSTQIEGWYEAIVQELQVQLQRDLSSKGIGIECNPSSNCLIGTFGKYENHPIFRFNRAYLDADNGMKSGSPQLSVSINTDDQGVFDTSLENEYALLADALRQCDVSGRRIYTEDQIYLYLDHIRELGNLQTFRSGFHDSGI